MKKPTGNMKRPNGGTWEFEETLSVTDPDEAVPKSGWALISKGNTITATLYFDGKPVKNVRTVDYNINAGSLPVLKIEIIAPEIKVINTGIPENKKRSTDEESNKSQSP